MPTADAATTEEYARYNATGMCLGGLYALFLKVIVVLVSIVSS